MVKVASPTEAETAKPRPGSVMIGFVAPPTNPDGTPKADGVQASAVESLARISRVQVMDALSS